MCDDIHQLLEQLQDLHKKSMAMCKAVEEMKKLSASARENSYGDVSKGLNKISKCIDAADAKLWDAQMLIEGVKVDVQIKIEKDEKDNEPDLFPEMKHGEVR